MLPELEQRRGGGSENLEDLHDYSKGMINLTPEDLHLNEQQRVYVPRRPQQNNNQRRPQQNNNQRKKY